MEQFDKKNEIPEKHLTVFKMTCVHLECIFRHATSIEINVEKKDRRIWNVIGFRKICNDESGILIWDYRKIHGFACGHLMNLVNLNSTGKKAFHRNTCSHLS